MIIGGGVMFIWVAYSKWFRIYFLILLGIFFIPINVQAVDSPPHHKSEKIIKAKDTLTKGQEQWKKGELKKAILSLEEAVSLDPSNNKTVKVLKSMQLQKKKLDGLLKEASSFILNSNYKEAKKSLKKASWISGQYKTYQEIFQQLEEKDLTEIGTLPMVASKIRKKECGDNFIKKWNEVSKKVDCICPVLMGADNRCLTEDEVDEKHRKKECGDDNFFKIWNKVSKEFDCICPENLTEVNGRCLTKEEAKEEQEDIETIESCNKKKPGSIPTTKGCKCPKGTEFDKRLFKCTIKVNHSNSESMVQVHGNTCPDNNPGIKLKNKFDTNNNHLDNTYIICNYYQNRMLKLQIPFRNGKKHGIKKWATKYGEFNKSKYINGIIQRSMVVVDKYVKHIRVFKNGKKDYSYWVSRKSGKKSGCKIYINGKAKKINCKDSKN